MKRPTHQNITQWLIFDFVRRNLKVFPYISFFAGFLIIQATNEPVSSRIVEGKFVRLTGQADKGPGRVWIYVEFPNGWTTAVVAKDGWQPPAVGSVVRLQEWTFRWFGRSYSLVP